MVPIAFQGHGSPKGQPGNEDITWHASSVSRVFMNIIKWQALCFPLKSFTDDHSNSDACYQLHGATHFEDRFCASKKGGRGKVMDFTSRWQRMAAVAAGCRKALASTGLTISLLSCTIECRKFSLYLVGTPILAFWAAFSSEDSLVPRLSCRKGGKRSHPGVLFKTLILLVNNNTQPYVHMRRCPNNSLN